MARKNSPLFEARLNKGDFAGALRALFPSMKKFLPESLKVFLGFTFEAGLLSSNPNEARLKAAAMPQISMRLKRLALPLWKKQILWAVALTACGRYRSAVRALEAASKKRPEHPQIALWLGALYWLLEDKERTRKWISAARKHMERAEKLGENSPELILLRAQIHLELEENRAALKDLESLLQHDPENPGIRIEKAEIYADFKDFRRAMREIKKAGSGHRGAWWLFAQQGRIKALCGYLEEALKDLSRALALNPVCGPLYAWRAEVQRKLARYSDAMVDLNRAIQLDPRYPFSWECRGRLHLLRGDPASAFSDLTRALKLSPRRSLAFAWRAEAAVKLGKFKQARRDFAKTGGLDPRNTWNLPLKDGEILSREKRQAAFWQDLEKIHASRA